MRVYNVSTHEVTYKGKNIPPNGGSAEFKMDFIPNRDLALQDAKVLAFGALPKWWKLEQALQTTVTVSATVMKPGAPNQNGDVFPEKKIVITTDAPVEVLDKVSVSMSTKRK